MEMQESKKTPVLIAALILGIGILGSGYFIGRGFYTSKIADRFVTVKGLAEKDVVADLAIWNIKLTATGDNLTLLQESIEHNKQDLISFLKQQGVSEAEIQEASPSVVDLMAKDYRSENINQGRFIITFPVVLRSTHVGRVQKVSTQMGEIVKKGIVFSDDWSQSGHPSYFFTGLNEIKPEMIATATKNARKAAEQFAADSGSKVASIRRANQGFFSIESREGSSSDSSGEGGGNNNETRSIEKKVRVVTTIDYYLMNL